MIIFDDGLGTLGVMTDLRASFEVRTGMQTTAARIIASRSEPLHGYWVRAPLDALVAERCNAPVNRLPDSSDDVLCVNGRWMSPNRSLRLEASQALVEKDSGDVVAARLTLAEARQFLARFELPDRIRLQTSDAQELFRFPWDVIAALPRNLAADLAAMRMTDAQLPSKHAAVAGDHPVEVHATARVGPHVVFDAEQGTIVVHERAVIRPGAILIGPCAVGRDSTVVDGAVIKANTAIGPMCKVGGEVGGTIFQGYSNKAHDGHLGDSYVGKWVNFGAGTTNSNLLNTYGEVTMRPDVDRPRQRTGLTFLGSIVGDHVKLAISTRLMTGSLIGTGAMIATTAAPPTTVRRFAWLTDPPGGVRLYQLDKFLDVMRTVMARRKKSPSSAYLHVIKELHASATR
jgi:UDP-N-acetylglucosamine diphosphorylase/glucosamine-1-phosphate N-acetyltransferase